MGFRCFAKHVSDSDRNEPADPTLPVNISNQCSGTVNVNMFVHHHFCVIMCWSGMGSHHQAWHAVSEENQSPAATVWCLPARDACKEEEGGFGEGLVSHLKFIRNPVQRNDVCLIQLWTTTTNVLSFLLYHYQVSPSGFLLVQWSHGA